jgi:hypothetical protein
MQFYLLAIIEREYHLIEQHGTTPLFFSRNSEEKRKLLRKTTIIGSR